MSLERITKQLAEKVPTDPKISWKPQPTPVPLGHSFPHTTIRDTLTDLGCYEGEMGRSTFPRHWSQRYAVLPGKVHVTDGTGWKKTINNPFQWCTVIVFSWYPIWRCPPWWYHSSAYTSQEDAIILMTRMCEPFYHVSQCIKCIFKKCTVSRLGDLRQSPAGCLAGDWFLSETLVVISAAPLLALFFGHYTYITLIWSVK